MQFLSSVAALRAIDKTQYSQACVTSYYGDDNGVPSFYFLSASTGGLAADDGSINIGGADDGWWKLCDPYRIDFRQAGVRANGVNDDYPALSALLAAVHTNTPRHGGGSASLYLPAGMTVRLLSGITIQYPVNIECESIIDFAGTSGTAVTIGGGPGWSQGYELNFAGIVASAGNTAQPDTIDPAGTNGVRVAMMNFSRIRFGALQGFTNTAFFGDGSGAQFAGQIIQHNTIELGQVVNNGIGIKLLSLDAATSSFEANRVKVQNVYQNVKNIIIDDSSHNASTSNTFDVDSMDDCASGGIGVDLWGGYNTIEIGYTAAPVHLNGSVGNSVRIANNFSSGSSVDYGTMKSLAVTGPTDPGMLPATMAISPGEVYRNTYGIPIAIYFSANITPTASSSETVNVFVGPTNPPDHVNSAASGGMSSPDTKVHPFSIIVPPGYYWYVQTSGSGSAMLSSATLQPC